MTVWSAKLQALTARPGGRARPAVEILLAALVVIGLGHALWRLLVHGYLPHPFQAEPWESFMDFYNTAFWAHRPGAYAQWRTVYPPLSFVFLRLWTPAGCYRTDAYAARTCDAPALAPMVLAYLLNAALVYLAYRRLDRRTAAPRAFALCAGMPMLYGLELANLIIPCFTAFVLAEGGLIRSPTLRAVCSALAINFKPYLLLTLLPRLARRRWGFLFGVGAAGLAIYGVTYALEGAGSPWDIFHDLFDYAGGMGGAYAERNHLAAIAAASGGAWAHWMPPLIRVGEVTAIGGLGLSAFARPGVPPRRLIALALSLICSEAAIGTQGYSADYTQIFLLFLVFMEPWETVAGAAMLTGAYLLCVCGDVMIIPALHIQAEGYLSGRPVAFEVGLMASQFIRPLLLLTIQLCLVIRVVGDFRTKPAWPPTRAAANTTA